MKITITGQDTLADAAFKCCSKYFDTHRGAMLDAAVTWCCWDTPIGPDDRPDTQWVIDQIASDISQSTPGTIILVSSQIKVGTTAKLERLFPHFRFAHSPENIRVATAEADFGNQSRIVVGLRKYNPAEYERTMETLRELFAPFTKELIVTDPESAECAKHCLNTFLGLQIAFVNEAARFCREVGADPAVVSRALLTDFRVSPKAPLRPGAPFGGGHLARDIYTVNQIAAERRLNLPLISHIMESNRS